MEGASLPVRGRGSKLVLIDFNIGPERSLPLRERGSKPHILPHLGNVDAVAPHAGAWIETGPTNHAALTAPVAPRAGAWIETTTPRAR